MLYGHSAVLNLHIGNKVRVFSMKVGCESKQNN